MPSKRIKQVNTLIQEELGSIISKEIELPSGCLATISKVETSPDLKHAVIWLSILPLDFQKETVGILNKKKKNLQKILNTRLKTKNTPQIHFKIDESEEKAERISRLLDMIKK